MDKSALNSAVSKLIAASAGEIAIVFSKSAAHKHFSLADIEWMVLPAVVTGQFYVAEVVHQETGMRAPAAAITWASVSGEIDTRLREEPPPRLRLAPQEWKSGPHLWLVDAAGDPRAIAAALKALGEGPFKDKTVGVITRDASGTLRAETLQSLMAQAASLKPGSA